MFRAEAGDSRLGDVIEQAQCGVGAPRSRRATQGNQSLRRQLVEHGVVAVDPGIADADAIEDVLPHLPGWVRAAGVRIDDGVAHAEVADTAANVCCVATGRYRLLPVAVGLVG